MFGQICFAPKLRADPRVWIMNASGEVMMHHEPQFMMRYFVRTYDTSWALMMWGHHEMYSRCIMGSTHDASWELHYESHNASWALMMHREYSSGIMNTHDASWVLLLMHHEYLWCIMRTPSGVLMMHREYSWYTMSTHINHECILRGSVMLKFCACHQELTFGKWSPDSLDPPDPPDPTDFGIISKHMMAPKDPKLLTFGNNK